MYDVDNNGYIERDEMLEIVKAIYAIKPEYVKQLNNTPDDFVHSIYRRFPIWTKTRINVFNKISNHTKKSSCFHSKMDKNHDGQINLWEFTRGVKADPSIVYSRVQ